MDTPDRRRHDLETARAFLSIPKSVAVHALWFLYPEPDPDLPQELAALRDWVRPPDKRRLRHHGYEMWLWADLPEWRGVIAVTLD